MITDHQGGDNSSIMIFSPLFFRLLTLPQYIFISRIELAVHFLRSAFRSNPNRRLYNRRCRLSSSSGGSSNDTPVSSPVELRQAWPLMQSVSYFSQVYFFYCPQSEGLDLLFKALFYRSGGVTNSISET